MEKTFYFYYVEKKKIYNKSIILLFCVKKLCILKTIFLFLILPDLVSKYKNAYKYIFGYREKDNEKMK
ncbi:hypothetical protein PFAG_05973, partial [Plasmodium falciparum Santa Lucia]